MQATFPFESVLENELDPAVLNCLHSFKLHLSGFDAFLLFFLI